MREKKDLIEKQGCLLYTGTTFPWQQMYDNLAEDPDIYVIPELTPFYHSLSGAHLFFSVLVAIEQYAVYQDFVIRARSIGSSLGSFRSALNNVSTALTPSLHMSGESLWDVTKAKINISKPEGITRPLQALLKDIGFLLCNDKAKFLLVVRDATLTQVKQLGQVAYLLNTPSLIVVCQTGEQDSKINYDGTNLLFGRF